MPRRKRNRGGKGSNPALWIIAIALVALVIGGAVMFSAGGDITGAATQAEAIESLAKASACPDDGVTELKVDLFNLANSTGNEGVDATVYVFDKSSETLVATITDTTSPSATSLQCGKDYSLKMISTSGASGDPSVFDSVKADAGSPKLVNGDIEFSADGAQVNMRSGIEQHSSLNCRAKDLIADALMYDSADGNNLDYETDGVTFTSTVNNATASTETDGLDIEFQCRAVESDTDYNDRGVLVLLEMPTTSWEEPQVFVNGQALSELTLQNSEADAYVDYEYAYLIPKDIVMKDGGEGFSVRVATQLKAGVSSVSADPQVDLAPRGSALSTDGQSVLQDSAVTDAASPAQIHTLYDMTIDFT